MGGDRGDVGGAPVPAHGEVTLTHDDHLLTRASLQEGRSRRREVCQGLWWARSGRARGRPAGQSIPLHLNSVHKVCTSAHVYQACRVASVARLCKVSPLGVVQPHRHLASAHVSSAQLGSLRRPPA
jgi:hypothetical protein